MARTDPPIKLKRSVLRRVVSSKLDSLRRGDFYVSKHLGPECYDPIVAEAKAFLDSPQYQSLAAASTNHAAAPQDVPPPPSLSEDYDTFIGIIAASILIDASMRGENAGESDPRFIKKKKKLLTKTLKGIKFIDFTSQIWRYDCLKRGINLPPEEESEEDTSESESSDSDDQDNTSVTSHTASDGFSTSASSKKHHHGSSSSSARKKHKKEKKRLKRERKQKRKEERRRRKEERRRKKEDKKKKKRKREEWEEESIGEKEEEQEEDEEIAQEENDEPAEDDSESMYEIEHATKEEFDAFREEILSKIPNKVKNRFREGGFSRWGKDWLPVLEIGPFDVEPGPVRSMWMEMFQNTRQNGREMTRLVFWYGVRYEDRGQAYSFVPSNKLISFEEGEEAGHCNIPKKIRAKLDKKLKLTKTEEQIERGLRELQEDMKKSKNDRIQWMMNFQEDYELAESMEPEEEPEPEVEEASPLDDASVEVKVKRKPGRPKKSESQKKSEADPDKPVKRKPGRPKKSETADADAPVKRKPGRPKKSEAEKAKTKKAKSNTAKKFDIIDEDDDFALEDSDDDEDKDYHEGSSDDSSVNDSDDADDELSNAGQRKRKAAGDLKKPNKRSKSNLTEEEEKEERRRKAAEYREKKRREKAEALGLDYVPGRKKSKKKMFQEEQARFTECEDIFLPFISDLEKAKGEHNVKSVVATINKIIQNVETLTPPFLRTYPLGMLVREVRKAFEGSDPEVKEHCKRLTNEMKRVYNQKDKNTPDDFVPKTRASKEASTGKSDNSRKAHFNDVSMTDAVKTEDTSEHPTIRNHTDATTFDQSLRTSEIVTTDPVKTDPVKSEPTKPPKKTFSIKGMFEKPKPIPKPKVAPAIIVSGPVSPKPKALPEWVTGPALKGEDEFHESLAKERNLALEFLNDAASTIPSNKIDPMSISQSLELAIFAETKLRGRDWNQYWEKVHDVVAMISPGKNQPNAIALGIARGDYLDPSQLLTLSRREIHSLNQQRAKSI
ncbi:hypothetical protein ACHAXN_004282 [Cyclotella atomus]